jgi:hypothetical protein
MSREVTGNININKMGDVINNIVIFNKKCKDVKRLLKYIYISLNDLKLSIYNLQ